MVQNKAVKGTWGNASSFKANACFCSHLNPYRSHAIGLRTPQFNSVGLAPFFHNQLQQAVRFMRGVVPWVIIR